MKFYYQGSSSEKINFFDMIKKLYIQITIKFFKIITTNFSWFNMENANFYYSTEFCEFVWLNIEILWILTFIFFKKTQHIWNLIKTQVIPTSSCEAFLVDRGCKRKSTKGADGYTFIGLRKVFWRMDIALAHARHTFKFLSFI